jgi:short subunit dehydrogenase-like uncharacterized protein
VKEGVLIYGCYGYTGKLISELAVKQGLKPVLAGRDAQKVAALATKLGLEHVAFDLDNEQNVAEQLKPFKVVLHCAGPFIKTVKVMAAACIKAKTHYLDITGEYQVYERIFKLNAAAVEAGIMLMPGVGFDVVPTDCMSLYLREKMPKADTLELALYAKGGKLSHGTAITIAENLGDATVIRRNGKLAKVHNGKLIREVVMQGEKKEAVAISWGDVSTAFRTTGIPNITVYNVLPRQIIDSMKMSRYIGFFLRMRFVKNIIIERIKKRPAGPNEIEREAATSIVWGEVSSKMGGINRAVLYLPEGYTLTAHTAIKIVQYVLENEPPSGSKTPAQVFGADFILQFAGVTRKDVQ